MARPGIQGEVGCVLHIRCRRSLAVTRAGDIFIPAAGGNGVEKSKMFMFFLLFTQDRKMD